MSRDKIVKRLQECESELRAMGVVSLSLFGSVARGEDGPQSDVDVAVTLDDGKVPAGLAYFGHLDALQSRLEKLLDKSVDVVEEPARKPTFQAEIDKDRRLAF